MYYNMSTKTDYRYVIKVNPSLTFDLYKYNSNSDKWIKNKKDKGLSLIEALVCIVIVGIGFIGVNQMISYATSSMDRALESNKINFLSETAVEDIMGDVDNALIIISHKIVIEALTILQIYLERKKLSGQNYF